MPTSVVAVRVALLLLLVVAAAGAPAAARERPAPARSDANAKAKARLHFQRAAAHVEARRYDEAVDEYLAAYRFFPSPKFWFNIAEAYRLKGDRRAALKYYGDYLAAEPSGPTGDTVRGLVEQLNRELEEEARAKAPPPAADRPIALVPAPVAEPAKARPRWPIWLGVSAGVAVVGGVVTAVVVTQAGTDFGARARGTCVDMGCILLEGGGLVP